MATILKTQKLVKIYEGKNSISVKALDNIDIAVEKGEFLGVMGPSGSGKTTLLNVLSGIDKPTSGSVEIDGISIGEMNRNEIPVFRREKLGFVFQDFNLLDTLTVSENIALPMTLDKNINAKDIDKRTAEIMRLLGILDIREKYPYQLSGGQQQRVAIGRALVNKPMIIFADEPTGNLDSKSANSIMSYLEKINDEEMCTIILVTHDAFAASFCKKIIFIRDGAVCNEIVKKGSRKEFYSEILDSISAIEDANNIFGGYKQ